MNGYHFVGALVIGIGVLSAGATHAQTAERKEFLLNVSKGQIPNDTGNDGQTKMTIESAAEIGDSALKVVFASGDSFGDRLSKVKNWAAFERLQLTVVNLGKELVTLDLNVLHKGTTNYQTRTVLKLELKPGKNAIDKRVDALRNVNGSKPDLSHVKRWFINCEQGKTPKLLFGDIVLAGGGQPPASVSSDPARLERIRAAKMPEIKHVVLFDTPEADAILSAMEIFPANNPWNLVVSDWPVHPRSNEIVASIGREKKLRVNDDMCFVIVPPNYPKIEVKLAGYTEESDKGPFPVPDNLPIEGWPKSVSTDGKPLTLEQAQRRPPKYDSDRHGIIVDPVAGKLYEFFVMGKVDAKWVAEQSSIFDLKSNRLRPDGWTSADAAGLPIFPAIIRYDELQRGEVEHAMRFTVRRSRKSYVYPATHHAGHGTDESLPRMGERFRLKKDVDISKFSGPAQAILKGLKKYGMFVADNGLEWSLSMAPDPRIPTLHEEIGKLHGSDFEVIEPPPGYQPAND